jgi:hypothetical protein
MSTEHTPSNPLRGRRLRKRAGVALTAMAFAIVPVGIAHAGPGADAEVGFAQNAENTNPGDATYTDGCLLLMGNAADAAGIDYRSQIDVPIGSDTYPDDLLGHFTGGTWSTDQSPPPGAWIFWTSSTGDRTLSHVALSIGNGQVISTNDSVDEGGIHTENISDHSYATYDGWWLPAGA